MHTAKEFNDLIIKEDNNNIVRFSDIGRAEVAPRTCGATEEERRANGYDRYHPPTGSQPYRDRDEATSVSSNYKKTCRKMSRSR